MSENNCIGSFFFGISEAFDFVLGSAWAFLSSQFTLTLIGTSVAAFAGVYGAHIILERYRRREEWLRELRITNAATMVSFEICNSFLSIKDQQVKGLGEQYDRDRNSLIEFENSKRNGQIPPDTVFELRVDFRSINPMIVPEKILVKQIFEEISAGARAYTLTNILIRTIDSLNRSIVSRNELINIWKNSPEKLGNNAIRFYFGLPDSDGHVDQRYPDSIKGICSLTDDSIFFSQLLCTDLIDRGEQLKKLLGKRSPNVNRPNFSIAVEKGLMPSPENYEDWVKAFVDPSDLDK